MRGALGAVAIALAACGVASARAQEPGHPAAVIEWSEARKLNISDFKGRIPARASEASLSWIAIEASWECAEGKGSSQARAVFDPARSWWREANTNLWQSVEEPPLLAPGNDNGRNLLEHEQVHFDLTELWVRRIRDKFKALPAVCKNPGGAQVFEKVIADMERDWREEQKKYDKETDHGVDPSRQRAWGLRARKALQERYAAAAR